MATGGENGPDRATATGWASVPHWPKGRPDSPGPASPASGARVLALTAMVVVTSLTGIYLLGRVLGGADQAAQQPRATTGARSTPAATAPTTGSPTPTASPSATVPDAASTGPPLPPERGGPFGSRQTSGSRAVALTFDDGPDPAHTPEALAVLRRHQVKATFCLVGENVRRHPELVRAIAADGHTLCNHSWSHDFRLGSRSRATILSDLIRTNEAIQAAVPGVRVSYFRQPGGYWTSRVVAAARQLGMTSLHWAVDPRDWREPGARSIAGFVIGHTFPGAIVLLHDAGGDRAGTIAALTPILSDLTRRFQLDALPTEAGGGPRR